MKKLLSVLLVTALVLAALPLTALPTLAATSGDFTYEVISETDKTCEITDYTGSATALTIPSELDGYTVTSIDYGAFEGCTSLTSITIPDSVTSIGDWAFSRCTALESITIPDSVKSINYWAFAGCTALTDITIPNSVKSIGEGAFSGCTALTEIKVDTGNPNYTSESGVLFNRNKTALICYPAGKQDSSYIVPDSVTSFGEGTFWGCTSLVSVTIPNSVTSIGYGAFRDCTALESITIPNSVTSIDDRAFSGCTALTNITIPDSVTSIGWYAFSSCTALTSITIPNSVTSIEDYAFYGCAALTSISIPNSVTSIGEGAFYDCTALTSITIPDSVTGIGNKAFYKTAYYNDATHWENNVLYIGNHLIDAKNTLSGAYTVRAGTKTIADMAFYDCPSLTSITIPNSVTSIGYRAFDGCTLLTTIYGYTGSYAETYANTNGYTFVALPSGIQDGDVNGDDKINAVDARWVLQAASGVRTFDATQTAAADVNGDGKVNAVDARWILQIASGSRIV